MQTVQETLNAGLNHHRSGEILQAVEQYNQVLRIDPHHADALHLLGVVAFQEGNHESAENSIRQAIELKPKQVDYFCTLATVYRACGRLAEAATQCQKAIELDPFNANAHNNYGNVLRDQGDLEKSEASFRRALAINPKFSAARENLESLDSQTKASKQAEELPNVRATECAQSAETVDPNRLRIDSVGLNLDTQQRTVLHVGSGLKHRDLLHKRFQGDEWKEVRLDINPDVKPDIVASLTDMQGVEDESVDAVWSSHNIEHLYAHEVPVALSEFFRVLKRDGMVLITLPDLQQVAEFIVADRLEEVIYESPAGPITPLDCLYGLRTAVAKDNFFMSHHTGFTATSLKQHLENAGFVEINVWHSQFNLWAEAWKR